MALLPLILDDVLREEGTKAKGPKRWVGRIDRFCNECCSDIFPSKAEEGNVVDDFVAVVVVVALLEDKSSSLGN